MAIELYNIDTDAVQVYQQYAPPVVPIIAPVVATGATTVVTTINGGGGGQATGPAITFTSSWSGVNFTASAGNVTLEITNAANARAALSAAASGVNTDITQLNGASQVDVTTAYKVTGTKVVGAQGAAVPNATGGATIDAEARTAINDLLARLRAHGLIAP